MKCERLYSPKRVSGIGTRVLSMLVLFMVQSCSRPRSLPSHRSAVLVAPPGAQKLDHRVVGDAEGLAYELQAAFPAADLITDVFAAMSKNGWQPLGEDWLGQHTAYGAWGSYEDGRSKPSIQVYAWDADWRNARGQIASYSLRYVFPDETKLPMSKLRVKVQIIGPDSAKAIRGRIPPRKNSTDHPTVTLPDGTVIDTRTIQTELPVESGQMILMTSFAGAAAVQFRRFDDSFLAYHRRFRDSTSGEEKFGAEESVMNANLPTPSRVKAGAIEIDTFKPSGSAGTVSFQPREMEVIRLPGSFYETLSLADVERVISVSGKWGEGASPRK